MPRNKFWIEVRCEYRVYDKEWAQILLLINTQLAKHQFGNVHAVLCEDATHTTEVT